MSSVTDASTRDRILDAARSAFLERGTSGARTQEIADVAGVNKALIHYYFGNKDALARAVFEREFRGLVGPVLETMGSPRSLEEKVRDAVRIYLDGLAAFPQLPAYIIAEMHFHPERMESLLASLPGGHPSHLSRHIFGVLGTQLDAAAAEGLMRPISARHFLVNLVSLCVFPFAARPMLQLLSGPDQAFDDFIAERRDSLADFFLAALRP